MNNLKCRPQFVVALAIALMLALAVAFPAGAATYNAQCGDTITVAACPAGTVPTSPTTQPPATIPPVAQNSDADCHATGQVRHMTMDWFNPHRLYTRDVGGFGPDDAIVVEFTTGMVSTTNSLPRIAAAEYQSSPSSRIATLSLKPCDFGAQQVIGAAANEGNSVTMVFALGTGTGYGYYPVFPLQTKVYLNIKNSPQSSCVGGGASCDMFVDLLKAGGL